MHTGLGKRDAGVAWLTWDGPCGVGRLALRLAACALFFLSSCTPSASPSAVTVYEASFRGPRPVATEYPPAGGPNEGRPVPGWRQVSGKWQPGRGGFLAEIAGELRSDGIDLSRSNFRAELLADVSGAVGGEGDGLSLVQGGSDAREDAGPLLAVEIGGLRAGLHSHRSAFIEVGGEVVREDLGRPLDRGRFRLVIEADDGLISVRTRRNRGARKRDVFRRWTGGPRKGVSIHASAGVVVYSAGVRTIHDTKRPETLVAGDRAFAEGHADRAAALYSETLVSPPPADAVAETETGPLLREQAEAAYKLGLMIRDSEPEDSARAFDRAQRLDPEGPWGERARLELARAAISAGREGLALAFARSLVMNAAPGVEEWREFRDLISGVCENLVSGEQGVLATGQIRLIAEYLEWAGAPRERVLWAWSQVVLSYTRRGRHNEADAVRDRTERHFGEAEFPGKMFRRAKPGEPRPKNAPSILPETATDRRLREKMERRRRKGGG